MDEVPAVTSGRNGDLKSLPKDAGVGLEFGVRCINLFKLDKGSESDPVVRLSVSGDVVSETEEIRFASRRAWQAHLSLCSNNRSPTFQRRLVYLGAPGDVKLRVFKVSRPR